MKITLIGTDLSINEAGRVYLLAEMLKPYFEVTVVGATSCLNGSQVWSPISDSDISFIPIESSYKLPGFFRGARHVLQQLSGDLIYAVAPQIPSFGLALLNRAKRRTPVMLDIVDWEFPRQKGSISLYQYIRGNRHVRSYLYMLLMEKNIRFANAVTCSNSFLQERFGGTVIPHAKNTDHFNPERCNQDKTKDSFCISGRKVVMFAGTPRRHKGLEDLFEATSIINDPEIVTVVLGANPQDPYVQQLQGMNLDNVIWIAEVPFKKLPEHLAMADVMVIPQRDLPYSHGQIPAKLFDAMAMGKPIVSTRMNDIPKILDECGIIVPAQSPPDLALAIKSLLANDSMAQDMGKRARQKCIAEYSWTSVGKQLSKIVTQTIADHPHSSS